MQPHIPEVDCFVAVVAPTVASINPANGPTVGGTVVTITGTNFGTSNSVVSATIGGVSSPSCVWTSDSTMACEAPPGIAADQVVDVTIGEQTSTSTVEYAYDGIVARAIAYKTMQPQVGCSDLMLLQLP